jgi:hypothetical protein
MAFEQVVTIAVADNSWLDCHGMALYAGPNRAFEFHGPGRPDPSSFQFGSETGETNVTGKTSLAQLVEKEMKRTPVTWNVVFSYLVGPERSHISVKFGPDSRVSEVD